VLWRDVKEAELLQLLRPRSGRHRSGCSPSSETTRATCCLAEWGVPAVNMSSFWPPLPRANVVAKVVWTFGGLARLRAGCADHRPDGIHHRVLSAIKLFPHRPLKSAPCGRRTNCRRDDSRGPPRSTPCTAWADDPGGQYMEVLPRRPPATLPSTFVASTGLTRARSSSPGCQQRSGSTRSLMAKAGWVESTRPSLEMLESGRRPLVARGCDSRRPRGESCDRRAKSWGIT